MKLILLLAASAFSLANADATWTFERQGLTAVLSEVKMDHSPLRLTCSKLGYLEINIFSGQKPEVTLIGPSKFSLTLRGELSVDGRLTSNVHFKSLTVEFLREEGDVEVVGGQSYRMHLNGARRVIETLESSCLAVS